MYLPCLSYFLSFFKAIALKLLESTLYTLTAIACVASLILMYAFGRLKSEKKVNLQDTTNPEALDNLHQATFENDVIASVRLIQKYPWAINHPHPVDGYTPFMRACLNGNTQLVRFMLDLGGNTALKSIKGETPFYLATFYLIQNRKHKDASCIHALYYAGSDVNATNAKGYTPLQMAAMFGHTQLVIWLLNKGACAVLQPEPYMLARLQGHYETAKILKSSGLPAIE